MDYKISFFTVFWVFSFLFLLLKLKEPNFFNISAIVISWIAFAAKFIIIYVF